VGERGSGKEGKGGGGEEMGVKTGVGEW